MSDMTTIELLITRSGVEFAELYVNDKQVVRSSDTPPILHMAVKLAKALGIELQIMDIPLSVWAETHRRILRDWQGKFDPIRALEATFVALKQERQP